MNVSSGSPKKSSHFSDDAVIVFRYQAGSEATIDSGYVIILDEIFHEKHKSNFTNSKYTVKAVISDDESIGETLTLELVNSKVAQDKHISNEQSAASSELKTVVLKLPAHGDHTRGYSGINKHFKDESISLRMLAGDSNTNPEYERYYGKAASVLALGHLITPNRNVERIPVLLEEYIEGAPLPDDLGDDGQKYKKWIGLAFALANMLRRVHNRGIIHGSIHPRHVIVIDGLKNGWKDALFPKIALVGFGTSVLLYDESNLEAVKNRLKDQPYAAPELRAAGRFYGLFSFPADIYSLGVMLYAQATGSRGNEEVDFPRNVEALKTHISDGLKAIWKTEHVESIARVIDKCLRHDPNERFSCAEEMIDFILNAAKREDRATIINTVSGAFGVANAAVEFAQLNAQPGERPQITKNNALFSQFENVCKRLAIGLGMSVSREHCEYYGSRDEILNRVCEFMASLPQGAVWSTVTVPAYWTERNLGPNGRFLAKNKDMALAGVTIKRVFLVPKNIEFDQLPIDEQFVLRCQRRVEISLQREQLRTHNYEVRVREVTESELRDIERRRNFVAFVTWPKNEQFKNLHPVGLSFMSRGSPKKEFEREFWDITISKVRFEILKDDDVLNPQSNLAHAERFNALWNGSRALGEYIIQSKIPFSTLMREALALGKSGKPNGAV